MHVFIKGGGSSYVGIDRIGHRKHEISGAVLVIEAGAVTIELKPEELAKILTTAHGFGGIKLVVSHYDDWKKK